MSVTVTLPAMGESVTEGTIVKWLKREGERIEEDEPIVEISTDKIDTELPSPAAGILAKILVGEDQTVAVGTEIAVIDEDGLAAGDGRAVARGQAREARAEPPERPKREERPAQAPAAARRAPEPSTAGGLKSAVLSPLVRRLAREHRVDLSRIHGTGAGGRVTKADVLAFVEARTAGPAERGAPAPPATVHEEGPPPVPLPAGQSEDVRFSHVRRAIAEHMVRSRRTSAHVTNVVEVDMTRVARLRERAKAPFREAEGFGLTYLPFVAAAVVDTLRAFPEMNAHMLEDGQTARVFRRANLGIAVGRDEGLIVPVVHGADGMNLIGLARAIQDVGTRARQKGGLNPDDVAGGTFTITNNGAFGALIDTPIINQPQIAILGVGAVVKRPTVIEVEGADAIAVRHLMFLCLSYDHRWIDGHRAAQFNGRIKDILEAADFAHDLGVAPDPSP